MYIHSVNYYFSNCYKYIILNYILINKYHVKMIFEKWVVIIWIILIKFEKQMKLNQLLIVFLILSESNYKTLIFRK